MTAKQRLQLEQSEKREALSKLLDVKPEELTEEQRAEMDTLNRRLIQLEPELRSAITLEGTEQAQAAGQFSDVADGEAAEVRSLLERVSLADYLTPAGAGRGIDGAAKELNEALQVDVMSKDGGVAIPWRVLAGPEVRAATPAETRAFTTTAANDGPEMQRPILQRLFGPGIMDALGVRLDEVPSGRAEWPLLTGAVAPDQAKEGTAAAAAAAATFNYANLKPKRLTGRYEFTHEMAASVADIEGALRRDLGDAVKAKMSDAIINGLAPTTQNPQYVQGFLTAITAPGNPAAEAIFADYASSHAASVDGIHAETEKEVSSVIGVDVYAHAASVYQTGSGESGSEALMRRSMMCRASSYIPSADSNEPSEARTISTTAKAPMVAASCAVIPWPQLGRPCL